MKKCGIMAIAFLVPLVVAWVGGVEVGRGPDQGFVIFLSVASMIAAGAMSNMKSGR